MRGIEFTKWLGVVIMIYDHLSTFAGWPMPFVQEVGSIGFPMFALALGAALHDAGPAKLVTVVRRLLSVGLIAQVAVLFVRGPLPLNILFTMIAGLLFVLAVEDASRRRTIFYVLGGLALGSISEYSLIGTFLVVAALLHYRRGASLWWAVGIAVPLFVFNGGALYAPFGVFAAWWLVANGPELPRFRRVFYPIYVLQFPLLKFL